MRRLRIATPSQPMLEGVAGPGMSEGGRVWNGLPGRAREQTLVLLARLIARGVVEGDDDEGEV